jgi:ubiquinone biosynthesis protein UbiJ
MSYVHLLASYGVSRAGAEQAVLGQPLTAVADRRMMLLKVRQTGVADQPRFWGRYQVEDATMTRTASKPAGRFLTHVGQEISESLFADIEGRRVAALQAEIARIEREIDLLKKELTRLHIQLMALRIEQASGKAVDQALLRSLQADIDWILQRLASIEAERARLGAKRFAAVRKAGTSGLAISSAAEVDAQSGPNGAVFRLLAELARLEEEIERVKKKIERLFAEANAPGPPPPPATASAQTKLEWQRQQMQRLQQFKEALRDAQTELAELEARYRALLGQL